MRLSLSVLVVLAITAGCGEPPPKPAAPTAAASGDAPHPTSLDELRAGCPAGRVIELRFEASGKPVVISRMEFVKVDERSATIKDTTRTEDGKVVSEDTGATEWTGLYSHASFPASETTIESADVTVPAGSFHAKLYTVTHGKTVKRFWFAEGLAGPPVRFTTEEDGKRVFEGTMLRAR